MRPRTSLWTSFALKRDLWWQFTVRAVEMKHRGSYLGFLWAVMNPLLMATLYVLVFGVVFKGRFRVRPDETGIDYALGVFLGLILFHLVTETLGAAPTIIVGQPNLVKKVVFPLEVLPLAQLSAFWFHALISLVLFFVAALLIGRGVPLLGILWFPLILLPHLLLTLGLAWLLASLGVFFRDIVQIMPVLAQLLMYASAVFFSPNAIEQSPGWWAVLKWNPLLHTVDLARHALLWDQPLNLLRLSYTWGVGITIFIVGLLVFRLSKPTMAEAI